MIVLDIRDSKENWIIKLREISLTIGIDDLGEGSKYLDYIINPLPNVTRQSITPNFSGLRYLPIRLDNHYVDDSIKSDVLITFGGEDPKSLTTLTLDALYNKAISDKSSIFIIKGPLNKQKLEKYSSPNIKILESQKSITNLIANSNCIITSYGMTLYEALYLGKKVILINPTKYHFQLGEQVKSYCTNLGHKTSTNGSSLKQKLLNKYNNLQNISNDLSIKQLDGEGITRIVVVIENILNNKESKCPICNGISIVVDRNEYRNIYRCTKCKTIYRNYLTSASTIYEEDYFVKDYENQYGRTYLDDKNNINKLNSKRIEILSKIVSKQKVNNPVSLLDIGCAMGFFLEKAKEIGWDATGIEISKYASEYVNNTLSIRCINKPIGDVEDIDEKFDIITMWYFIEHNHNVNELLLSCLRLLSDDGVFAVSTPNSYGISYRLNKKQYLKNIPIDHYVEFNPKSLELFFKKRGFVLIRKNITGIHFNRVLPNIRFFQNKIFINKITNSIYKIIAQRFNLGDTFEMYFQRRNKDNIMI